MRSCETQCTSRSNCNGWQELMPLITAIHNKATTNHMYSLLSLHLSPQQSIILPVPVSIPQQKVEEAWLEPIPPTWRHSYLRCFSTQPYTKCRCTLSMESIGGAEEETAPDSGDHSSDRSNLKPSRDFDSLLPWSKLTNASCSSLASYECTSLIKYTSTWYCVSELE